jgi:hypothetical protein
VSELYRVIPLFVTLEDMTVHAFRVTLEVASTVPVVVGLWVGGVGTILVRGVVGSSVGLLSSLRVRGRVCCRDS